MNKKSCIIVCEDKEKVYANLLAGLIGEKGDLSVVIWKEKEFEDSMSKITSGSEIIFIGETKEAKTIIPNIQLKYDKCGMKYGWLGNRAVIYVEKRPLSKEEYERLKDEYQLKDDLFDKIRNSSTQKKVGIGGAAVLLNPIGLLGLGLAGAGGLVMTAKKRKEIRKYQYDCVIKAFFSEGLSQFMEE